MKRTLHKESGEEIRDAQIYRQVLGPVFDDLPRRLQQIHSSDRPQLWEGSASVQRGKGLLALVLASLFGFPQSADDVPVRVGRLSADGVELWTRDFGGKTFSTTQSLESVSFRLNHILHV